MSDLISRPNRGLRLPEALRQWSDPALYVELVKLAGTSELPPRHSCADVIRDPSKQKEYRSKRKVADRAFDRQLQVGAVLSSAIPEFDDARRVLDPSFWELDGNRCSPEKIVGNGRTYFKPEFFELTAIPLNIRSIPDWLDDEIAAAGLNIFRHDRDYRHVFLHDQEFALSDLQAEVVMRLHKAYLAGEPWQYGPKILEEAGSAQLKISDVFKSRKDWKLLIKSDGKGRYRLNMD